MDPELGRWLSLDPELGRLSQPQSMNRYVYCVNNPLRFVDPTGEWSFSKWWDKHGATVIQIAIIVVAVAATVATAGIASPALAMAVGAAIGATSSFASTYAATGDLGASLKSAAIGGIAGAVGGGIGAKLAQAGIGASLGSKFASKTSLGFGRASSGLGKVDDATYAFRNLFKHDFVRVSGQMNLGKLAGGSSYWVSRGFAVSDDAAAAFRAVMDGTESTFGISRATYAISISSEWKLVGRVGAAYLGERAGEIVFTRIGEWMSKRSASIPTFG